MRPLILIAGAPGYVGELEVVAGDVLGSASVIAALTGSCRPSGSPFRTSALEGCADRARGMLSTVAVDLARIHR